MLATLVSLVMLLADGAPKADLAGKVVTEDGIALSGAMVYVYSAAPRKGTASTGEFDYADCSKSTKADAQGAFKIEDVDSSLNYRLLVCADGYRPLMLKKVDPSRGEITARPKTLPKDLAADQMIKGHVTDANGDPIVGAHIDPFGGQMGNERWWGTTDRLCESEAWTDSKGEFVLITKKPAVQVDLKIYGRQAAPKAFPLVSTGEAPQEFALGPGASLTGRLVKDGAPLSGITIRICQQDRGMEHYINDFDAVTDNDGKFTFNHIMAKDNYYILATMASMNGQGALPLTACAVGDEGATTDAGDLAVENGNHVTGKVFTSDNKPIPAGAKVSIGRWDASDSAGCNVGADGKFEFKCVPSGLCEFYISINGYHISKDNQSFEPANAVFLLGRVDNDIDDLNVQLDPGPIEGRNNNSSQWQRLQTSQMTGIPAGQ